MHSSPSTFDFAPYRLSGTVYGTLLNHRDALAALGDAVNEPPYKAPPKAPVLYIKPRNTLVGHGAADRRARRRRAHCEIGANLGIVIGRTACRVAEADALSFVAGYTIVNDLSVPHDELLPAVDALQGRDGFCRSARPSCARARSPTRCAGHSRRRRRRAGAAQPTPAERVRPWRGCSPTSPTS